jgi:hypothetical protein
MPQDPDLYGQRASKKQKMATALPSSLDFTAQMTALMAKSKSGSDAAHRRSRAPKKAKEDIFYSGKSKRRSKQQQQGDADADEYEDRDRDDTVRKGDDGKLVLKEVFGTEEEAQERARAKRKLEDKARLYAAMKRGDYVAKENEAAPLVDFDRKWAENVEGRRADHSGNSSSDDDDSDEEEDAHSKEMVEYEDEFGRTRMVTRADKEKLERRARRGLLGAEELERMSARPSAPGNLIYGDAVQSMAFNPDDPDQMEALARKRDRSATPPDPRHYDADWEIRTKGTGFYKFSKDEETRNKEMQGLEEERLRTEQQRKSREDEKEARRREIEARRKEMADRRAKRQADNFLDGLAD